MEEKNRTGKTGTGRIYWNAFAAFRLGAGLQRAVLDYFGSAAEAVLAGEKEWQRFFGLIQGLSQKLSITATEMERVREVRQRNHKEELETFESRGIRFVTEEEEDFPERLRSLYDAPHWLYYLGALPEEGPQLAIIGARRCTPYGGAAARGIARALAAHGIGILSGLAYGVDTEAHEGAIAGGGKTYAVLGCGVDVCYPESSRQTYERILSAGGGILSEYPPGTPPLGCLFPQRNRIIAGLSDGILVTEAKKKSGSLITVSFGLEYGKTIYAVPGRITDIVSEGCNYLLREGAKPVLSAEDILEDFEGFLADRKKGKRRRRNEGEGALEHTLTPEERSVYASLRLKPKHIEEILEETRLSPGELPSVLQKLCQYGCIKRYGQAYYGRSEHGGGLLEG